MRNDLSPAASATAMAGYGFFFFVLKLRGGVLLGAFCTYIVHFRGKGGHVGGYLNFLYPIKKLRLLITIVPVI